MEKRNNTRTKLKSASSKEKPVLLQKYKVLRNKVTQTIRKQNIDFNNNRVEEAENEGELWKIAKEVTNPKSNSEWKLNVDGKKITDELEIAENFNTYFVEKIEK